MASFQTGTNSSSVIANIHPEHRGAHASTNAATSLGIMASYAIAVRVA